MSTDTPQQEHESAAYTLPRFVARLRQGQRDVAISEFKRDLARFVDTADRHVTVIQKHGKSQAVLMSYGAYQRLTDALSPSLEALAAEFDAALAHLQGRSGPAGMEAAFQAKPGEEGRRELKRRFGER